MHGTEWFPLTFIAYTRGAVLLCLSLQGYLEAKRDRMDHLLDGSWCYWNHDGEPTQPSATAHSAGGMGLPAGLISPSSSTDTQLGGLGPHTVEMDE